MLILVIILIYNIPKTSIINLVLQVKKTIYTYSIKLLNLILINKIIFQRY